MKTAEEIMTSHPLSNVPKYQMTNAEEHTWITDCMQEYADQFKPKWISVDDGLPKQSGNILISFPNDDNLFETCIFHFVVGMKVRFTHWMPLPILPIQ